MLVHSNSNKHLGPNHIDKTLYMTMNIRAGSRGLSKTQTHSEQMAAFESYFHIREKKRLSDYNVLTCYLCKRAIRIFPA